MASAGLNVTLDGQGKANGLGASFTGQLAHDGTLAGTIAEPRARTSLCCCRRRRCRSARMGG